MAQGSEIVTLIVVLLLCLILFFPCSADWYITYRLLQGVFIVNPNDPSSKLKKWKDLETVQILGIVVSFIFSMFVLLLFLAYLMFAVGQAQAVQSSDKDDKWSDHVPTGVATLFLVLSFILSFVGGLADVYLNIMKLDVFDHTISEASKTRKTSYKIALLVLFLMGVIWIFLYDHRTVYIIWFAVGYGWAVIILLSLTYEFGFRLSKFIQTTRRQTIQVSASIQSQSRSEITTPHEMSAPDMSLLSVIIKQSLLSMIKILSIILNGSMLLLRFATVLSKGFWLIWILSTPVFVILPLCVYLSFDFSKNEYEWLCMRFHNYVQNQAIESFQK